LMRVNTRVLAVELNLCPVVATTEANFESTREARDVEQDGMTSLARPGNELYSAVQVPELSRPW
jgi:hypothetical protein